MAEQSWNAARLIPTSGIGGADEQEARGTSALLAVIIAVKEFSRCLLAPLGAPSGTTEAYIEVPFNLGDEKHFPDGLIRVTRGKKTWTALVEVKTGNNLLDAKQLEAYLDIARENEFDSLITVSNQIARLDGTHPTDVDKRKTRKVGLHHLSWTQILTEAIMQETHRGVSDPDQAWILGELIRYLEHPKSGALEFDDMGQNWVSVRDGVIAGTLRAADPSVDDVCIRWEQLIRYVGLRLGRRLGTPIDPVQDHKTDTDTATRLVNDGLLEGRLRIPGPIGVITLIADLRAGRITVQTEVEAPKDGRPQTRVNWLIKQLENANEDLRIDTSVAHGRGIAGSALLRDLRKDSLMALDDPKKEPKEFLLALSAQMGGKRGQGKDSFVTSILNLVEEFYEHVIQQIKPWAPSAPTLRKDEQLQRPPARSASNALSSQDGPTGEQVEDNDQGLDNGTP